MAASGFPLSLQDRLRLTLNAASLTVQSLPELPGLSLYLLDPDFPRTPMSSDEMQAIWREPAYWIFCWASGLAMAKRILANPGMVRGKTVLDFGSGSGVVAIAAAMAGAADVIACDIDPLALEACRANASLNGVRLSYLDDFFRYEGRTDLLLAADVLYDVSNRFFLDEFLGRARSVLVADSRVRDFHHDAYRPLGTESATTWPDLDEFDEFRTVRFYGADDAGLQDRDSRMAVSLTASC